MSSMIADTEHRIVRAFRDIKTSFWAIEHISIEPDGSAKRKIIRLSPEEMGALVKVVLDSELNEKEA